LAASVGGTGICLVVAGVRKVPADVSCSRPGDKGTIRQRHFSRAAATRIRDARQTRIRSGVTATAAGLLAFILTGWPMSIPIGALAVLGLPGLAGGRAADVIERLEAIGSWTEMLRDTLA